MPTSIIRLARDTDAASVAPLLEELGYPATADEIRRRLRARRGAAGSADFVAETEGEADGFLSAETLFYFPEGTRLCRVTALVVASPRRGKGVGKALLAAATDFARSRGCQGLEITTAEDRFDTRRFYERMGFSRTSHRFYRDL